MQRTLLLALFCGISTFALADPPKVDPVSPNDRLSEVEKTVGRLQQEITALKTAKIVCRSASHIGDVSNAPGAQVASPDPDPAWQLVGGGCEWTRTDKPQRFLNSDGPLFRDGKFFPVWQCLGQEPDGSQLKAYGIFCRIERDRQENQ